MFTLFAKCPPLREVVGSPVEDIDLSVRAIGSHDILLDWLSNPNLFDEVVDFWQGVFPFLWRDDLDDTRLHSVRVDFLHLKKALMSAK
jgi:hypothetical protein